MKKFLIRHIVFLLSMAACIPCYLTLTHSALLGDFGGDAAVYVLSAQHYVPWSGGGEIAAQFEKNSQFPPLYPLLLAMTGGASSFWVAHAVTTICLLLAFAAIYCWLIEIGLGNRLAGFVILGFIVIPGTWLQALYLHSENLYLLLSMLALLALAKYARTTDSRWVFAAAIFVALSIVTRTAGIALLLALAMATYRRPILAAKSFFLALLFPIIWAVYHRPELGYSKSFVVSYSNFGADDLFSRLRTDIASLWWGFGANFIQTMSLLWVLKVIAVLMALALALGIRRKDAAAIYVVSYLIMVAAWPFPAESTRLIWVLIPLLMGLAAAAVAQSHWPHVRQLTAMLPAAILLLASPNLILAFQRFSQVGDRQLPEEFRHLAEWYEADPAKAEADAYNHLALVSAFRNISKFVPADNCVFSIKPALISLYSARLSKGPPSKNVDDSEFAAQIARQGCDYYLLLAFISPSYPEPFYPATRMEQKLTAIDASAVLGASGSPIAVIGILPKDSHNNP